ncbi:MAG: YihY/virulence factor BrkB family protein [Candidatus Xenobia bacterium]
MKLQLGPLVKGAAKGWSEDQASTLAAAIAFYSLFSMAPVLMVLIAVLGFVFGRQAATGEIMRQAQAVIGHTGAVVVQEILRDAARPKAGIGAGIIGLVMLFYGASLVFNEVQSALNVVWKVPRRRQGWLQMLQERLATFGMVLIIGLLLLVSLLFTTVISAVGTFLHMGGLLWQAVNTVVSFIILTGLFAAVYKILPDCQIDWKDVWFGGACTSLLFTIGKQLLGFYLGHYAGASAYGPAASLVVLLIWVFYSAEIFLFGAELTVAWMSRDGGPVCRPKLAKTKPRRGALSPSLEPASA